MRNQVISKTVITVTVILVAIAAGLYFFPKMKRGGSTATKTYVNEVYGVAFDYPLRYDLTEVSKRDEEGGPGVVATLIEKGWRIPVNGEGPTAITVGMYDHVAGERAPQDPVGTWIRTATTTSNFALSKGQSLGETRIGNKPALLYTWDGLYQGTSVVTEHQGNIIMFTVTYDGDKDMEKREDFTEIMNTVRFSTPGSATSTEQ